MKIYWLLIVLLFGLFNDQYGQNYAPKERYLVDSLDIESLTQKNRHLVDSCINIYHNAKHDTDKVNAISTIVEESWDNAVWPKYNMWIHDFAESKLLQKQTPEITKFLKIKLGGAINNLGYIHNNQGNVSLALEHYHKSLKIAEEHNDQQGIALGLNNIGAIYDQQGNIDIALEYFQKSLRIRRDQDDQQGIAYCLHNIGSIYLRNRQFEKALEYFGKNLDIVKEVNDQRGEAEVLNNLGNTYFSQEEYMLALENYKKSKHIREQIGDKIGTANSLVRIGSVQYMQGKKIDAEINGAQSLKIAQKLGYPQHIKNAAELLYNVYEDQGKGIKALKMYQLFIAMRDSILNLETTKSAIETQARYEYEKQKVINDKEHEKQIAIEQKEHEKQKILTYSASAGLILVITFLVFVFNRLNITQRQKEEISTQKIEIEETHQLLAEHHKEIQDSIHYAKYIQQAIMPSINSMNMALKDSFVLYQPKDVVAGDFFWMETVNDHIYYAAADCTGHGVPGAMVSMVCSNALTKALLEENITQTDQLLNRTREIVIDRFAKSEEEVKDGMDISVIRMKKEGEKTEIQYSGANNPLWIVKNDEIIEVKADRQAVGATYDPVPFTSHIMELNSGDCLYISTDGYQDQFGGAKGKKFKGKKLKELILACSNEPMKQQKEKLVNTFAEWKGHYEQVDDVCIIGVRV